MIPLVRRKRITNTLFFERRGRGEGKKEVQVRGSEKRMRRGGIGGI